MKHKVGPWMCVFIFGALCSAAQIRAQGSSPGERFLGTWTGTWEAGGAGSGGFELTLEKGADGALTGKVAVTGEPAYKAELKALSFDGGKMTAKYDFPPDEAGEVLLAGSFDGQKVDGTWALRDKAAGTEVATGSWTASKK